MVGDRVCSCLLCWIMEFLFGGWLGGLIGVFLLYTILFRSGSKEEQLVVILGGRIVLRYLHICIQGR